MQDEALNIILNRLDSIDTSLNQLSIGQAEIKVEQKEIRREQQEIRKEQQEIKKEQQVMHQVQREMRQEQIEMKQAQEEIKQDICKIQKTIKGLRDDVDTIYTLQQEDHKILLRHDKILNTHTQQLNKLIALAEENKEEHIVFDKRISRLEALIS